MNCFRLYLGVVLLASTPALPVGPEFSRPGVVWGEWTMDYEAAVRLAVEESLPILLGFTESDGCDWCQFMEERVFGTAQWKNYALNTLFQVAIDSPLEEGLVPEADRRRNDLLKALFNIRGVPRYVLVDSDGETLLGKIGVSRSVSASDFISQIQVIAMFSEANIKAFAAAYPDQGESYRKAVEACRDARLALTDWYESRPPRTPENEAIHIRLTKEIEKSRKALDAFPGLPGN